MATAGIPVPSAPTAVLTRRLKQAYPIYQMGYEVPLGVLDAWIQSVPGLLSYGRQGLFAHDNTHHALYMAYSAVDCLDDEGTTGCGRVDVVSGRDGSVLFVLKHDDTNEFGFRVVLHHASEGWRVADEIAADLLETARKLEALEELERLKTG